MLRFRSLLLATIALATLVGCGAVETSDRSGSASSSSEAHMAEPGSGQGSDASESSEAYTTEEASPCATSADGTGDPIPESPRALGGLEPLVAKATADLAQRLGVDECRIIVVLAEPIVWPNAARGCPQPGIEYADVQVEGWRTVLEYGGRAYSYHGSGVDTDPFLCEQPDFPSP